jgi:transposase-like protein
MSPHRPRLTIAQSAFAGFCFPSDVIVLAVRWYLRYGLSYRDVEELLAERGIEVDHVTVYRWVQRFTPLLAEAARPCRHAVGDRWQVDETYVRVAGRWRYVYRAIDQFEQVIDVFVSVRRNARAARRFFEQAIGTTKVRPVAGGLASHRAVRQQPARVRPRQAESATASDARTQQDRSARVVIARHAFVQNLRRGHYELAVEAPVNRRLGVAFDELALAI